MSGIRLDFQCDETHNQNQSAGCGAHGTITFDSEYEDTDCYCPSCGNVLNMG